MGALAVVAASSLTLASGASAKTFNVSNTEQFVKAVTEANGDLEANTIVVAGGTYLPEATVTFTNTSGLQTIEGPASTPGVKLVGSGVSPFPSELFVIEAKVSVTFKKVQIATGGGPGVPAVLNRGTLGLEASTVSGSSGTGILQNSGTTLSASNSTISDGSEFGVINAGGTASFFNSTVAFNKNGGIENTGTLNLTNTIVAENTGGDCVGAATTSDHSLDSDGSCGVGTLSKVNPLLQKQLLFDGGSTEVHSLMLGSPAIDAGDTTTCLATDQSGSPRPDVPGTACDIGADEFNATPVPSFAKAFTPEKIEGGFKEPDAVAVDPSGDIWVADSGHNRVLEFNKERKFLRQFGVEAGEGQAKGIQGIATNSAGDVYVTASDRVQEFSPLGEFLRQWGSPGSGNGQFLGPNGIAVDSSGNVWVVDTFNYRVQEFSETGAFLSQFGSKGTGNGQFGWASGLAFSGGNLYVADSSRVEEFSTAGTFIATFGTSGTGNGQFHGLGGIATDPTTGDLYVSDIFNNRVQKFTAAGVFISAVGTGGSGAGQFSAPRGVAVNSSGALYVADAGNNRVQEWLAGEPPTFATSFAPEKIEGGFKEPDAVAVDSSGHIWVADSGHKRVLEFNKEHEFLRQFGVEAGEGQAKGIQGIATNSAGDVYVTASDRVQEFSPIGEFLRQWGSPGSGNGQFLGPNGIAVDSSGNVWVVDTFNYRVQEFSETGAFLSQFGSKGTGNGQFGWASGLAFSGGNLYVADSSRVEEFSTAGTFIATFGTSGTGNGQFHGLGGIATDPTTGNLYVSDIFNNRVQEFTAAGAFIVAVGTGGSGAGQFSSPTGVAVNSSGTLYVADSGNNRAQEWLGGS
jgi:sugar lactone lactonase YvrE